MTNGGPFGSTRVLSFFMFEESLSEYQMWRDEKEGR